MSNRFGPPRGEIWFRLAFSLFGLGMMVFALATRGFGGIAWAEVVLISIVFFGGSALWAILRLAKPREDSDDV